ncbi:N-acyl amino acid synthase FeeM domain-containing protein [Cellulophaga baltica]|uniref:N-acyl amino acid synthase FeeM domain-containing protein n=1 Tax=Cellulophaga baltica TaxID=76594 RepID=UPI0037C65B86
MEFKIVSTDEEYECTDTLIQKAYHSKKLIEEGDFTHINRVKKHSFIRAYGRKGEHPIITCSAIISSKKEELPSSDIYAEEITELLKAKEFVAEVCLLADCRKIPRYNDLLNLLSLLSSESLKRGVTNVILSVHPNSCNFYESFFNCIKLGSEKEYEKLSEAPAQLMYCDLNMIDAEHFPNLFRETIYKYYNA